MPTLEVVMKYVKQIDEFIKDLRRGMAHTHPYSVDALRSYIDELEAIRDTLMNATLMSGENLDSLLQKMRECVRMCLHPAYTGKPQVLPKPIPDPWKPPVTVTGVNIIFVVDISDSMFERGGLEKGGRVRNLLVSMANEIERYAKAAKIPCKVSLVAFADPTNPANVKGHPFWEIILNKDPNVGKLSDAFSNINRNKWKRGKSNPESGMTCIYQSIDKVFDRSIVNGKSVENSLILVSDERQKLKGGNPGPHPAYPHEVTYKQIKDKLDKLKLFNRYALIPMKIGYTYNPRNKGEIGRVNWNSQIIPLFRQCREYWGAKTLKDVQDWITWTLDPTKAPKNKP